MQRIAQFGILMLISLISYNDLSSQHSVARDWNEMLLFSIRNDFARPTVHARNLWHTSIAMYDAWAAYEDGVDPYFLGNTHGGYTCFYGPVNPATDKKAAQEEAMSYAMYRLIDHRFSLAPNSSLIVLELNDLFESLGYDSSITTTDYIAGPPAALGNYIAECLISFGLQDGSNEQGQYANQFYQPLNPSIVMDFAGNPTFPFPNNWQPITLDVSIGQGGFMLGETPDFLSPEWGNVVPFSLRDEDKKVLSRNGNDYTIYHDPGMPPQTDITDDTGASDLYKWGFEMVSIWGSHLDPDDGVMIDISPATVGNVPSYPDDFQDYSSFYDFYNGGDNALGHALNPVTGQPYAPQIVKRGDYGRVLAEFWADGPDSETPPGHWFTILNYVNDHPQFEKRYKGQGPIIDDLEWDVKSYFMMGGAMHDCAISAWGIKGYYDYPRPVSVLRHMAGLGQSSSPMLPSYHPGGIRLYPGFIELVQQGDPLAGFFNENVGKIKLYTWKGPDFIGFGYAGVDWILCDNWWPYQRPTFVSPPFAGYVSGHSTYSRAAADILASITGSEFFPGGLGEFVAERNNFLVFEEGPSEDIVLQWATYRDASDQTSLSRIWGGIHPPQDDIPGRLIGEKIAVSVLDLAESIFYKDEDGDGFYNYQDCDDNNANVNPSLSETCDGLDNDCNNVIDDGLPIFTYYADIDGDGFGDAAAPLDTCLTAALAGYTNNDLDCNDANISINPSSSEIPYNGIDDDCDPSTLDDDLDEDGFNLDNDCDDNDAAVNPSATEIEYNGIDDDCNPATLDDDLDEDGFTLDNDCDDLNDAINPGVTEIEYNGLDDDCNPLTFDDDLDQDGFILALDCDDLNPAVNPNATEIVYNGIDDDCNPLSFDDDLDEDGFTLDEDCDDENSTIYPFATEIADNGIDEDCSGVDLYKETKLFPNPVEDILTIRYDYEGMVNAYIIGSDGRLHRDMQMEFINNEIQIDFSDLHGGLFILRITDSSDEELISEKLFKY